MTTSALASMQRVHRWTLLQPADPLITNRGRKRQRWLCRCDCGTEKVVLAQSLSLALSSDTGGSRSCGCLAVEQATRHGNNSYGGPTTEYMAWVSAKKRCVNPRNASFGRYGGRGIRMCERWRENFAAFLEDMGPKPDPSFSLDRIDSDGDYEPGNCRWASQKVQIRNRRATRWYEFEGQLAILSDIAEFFGITRDMAREWEHKGLLPARRVEGKFIVPDQITPLILDLNTVEPRKVCYDFGGDGQ